LREVHSDRASSHLNARSTGRVGIDTGTGSDLASNDRAAFDPSRGGGDGVRFIAPNVSDPRAFECCAEPVSALPVDRQAACGAGARTPGVAHQLAHDLARRLVARELVRLPGP
jgi:hypothetical protein